MTAGFTSSSTGHWIVQLYRFTLRFKLTIIILNIGRIIFDFEALG